MSSPLRPAPKLSGVRSGFALVIALSLMAFVLVLLLSLTTIVRVESSASGVAMNQLSAHQNALLGLMIGLGNLQKYAGPDQRVTANAEILSAADASKFKYVGVWDADPGSATYGEVLDWLASREQGGTFDPDEAFKTAAPTDWLELVSARTGVQPVRAEPVTIQGTNGSNSGLFSWVISDEGSKASLALAPHDISLSDARKTRFATRHAVELATGWGALSKDSQWTAVSDLMDVRLLAALTEDEASNRFHDYTPLSRGVLSDTRSGGLRRDLTVGLRAGSTAMEDDTGEDEIFPPQWGGSSQRDPGGPKWAQLRDFYNLRVGGTGAGTVALQVGSDDEVSITPVITWAQVYVHALRANGAGDRVRFYLMPAFAVWNPYQHNLTVPNFYIGVDLTNPRWIATSEPPASANERIARSSFPASLVWNAPGGTWAPGEVKMFSMNRHQVWPSSGNPDLSEGWFFGYGAYEDASVLDESVTPSLPTTLTPGANVQLAFQQSSGNSNFYLSLSDTDLDNNAFHQARRWVTWSEADSWRVINGSQAVVGPGEGEPPMAAGSHGNPMPRLGYMGNMKFAQEYLNMSWIGYPRENPFLGHYNPRSRFSSRTPSDLLPGSGAGGYNTNPLYTSSFLGGDVHYAQAGNYATGHSSTLGGGGLTEAGYFELLRINEPVVGIGQLMHAGLERTNNLQAESQGWLHTNIQPAFAIGNSLADPRIPDDATFVNWGSLWTQRPGTHYDQSWLLNDALWDRYFFSTVETSLTQAEIDANVVLPNPNLAYYQSPVVTDLKNYRLSASGLLNEGAFNVNSTSVSAWMAILGGLLGETVAPISGATNDPDEVPFVKTFRPMSGEWNNDASTGNRTHSGFRSLSESELRDLATEIVSAVQERSSERSRPFLSFAEFVNRSLTSSDASHRLRGVLQAAIDKSAINNSLKGGILSLNMTDSEKNRMAFREGLASSPTHYQPDNAEGDLLFGVGSYLTQAEVLAKIGHSLSARSDTFRIRSYGRTIDPISGARTAEVWVEALVQRTPEPVEAFGYDASDPENPENRIRAAGDFGRKFKVISYRFLDRSRL